MTGQEFSEVDFDLLADYVGGALDGTPEEAIVARRVAEEPAWAEAHAALVEATGSVRASLASLGASAEPMPAEISARITEALEREPHRPALSVVPNEHAGPRRAATRPRRRIPAWAGPAAIAAGVAALAGFGLSQAGGISGAGDDAGGSAVAPVTARDNAEAGPGAAPFAARQVQLAVSGRDYRADTLATVDTPRRHLACCDTTQSRAENPAAAAEDAAAPPELDRLRDPAAMSACVEAIATTHPPGITEIEVADLASYEGSPAVVVFFTDRSGARWVWASGPDCGVAGRGADTRGSAQIR